MVGGAAADMAEEAMVVTVDTAEVATMAAVMGIMAVVTAFTGVGADSDWASTSVPLTDGTIPARHIMTIRVELWRHRYM